MSDEQNVVQETLAVRNGSERTLTLYLEPWGEEYVLPPMGCYLVVGHGPRVGSGLEVAYLDQAVIVTAWKGATVQLFEQGKEVGSTAERPPVPDFL
jgi:hypothetical protein